MRIGVISDTHGRAAAVELAVKKLGQVDLWLHAGDVSQDAQFFAKYTKDPVIAVAGNCDGWTSANLDEYITLEGKKIWLTHGHCYDVKYDKREIVRLAQRAKVDVVIYGHSHIPDITWENNLLVFNPGSAAFPRGPVPTCGLLVLAGGKVTPSIVDIR